MSQSLNKLYNRIGVAIAQVTYSIMYTIILLLIFIGDAVKFMLISPFLLLRVLYKYLTAEFFFKINKHDISRYRRVSINSIASIGKNGWLLLREAARFTTTLSHHIWHLVYPIFLNIVKICVWIILLPYRFFISMFSVKLRFFLFGIVFCFIIVVAYQSYVFVKALPSPLDIGKVNFPLSTHIYDRTGRLLYEIYRDQNRTPTKLKELPDYIAKATIAIEDKDFYRHNGVSLFSGILRAMRETWKNHELQGGSTITQQLVKTALLSPERTIVRKVKEIILALWTERLYNKQQILEMYFNQVAYGGSAYGIEEAAKVYFGKDAKSLSIEEAALLAGLPQAPSVYSPFVNPDLALKRRNEVLNQMYLQKYITQAERDQASETRIVVIPLKTDIHAPHFVFYVKSDLEHQYGIRQVEEGGFRVMTTLDLDLQNEAEQILKEELNKVRNLNVTNGAILVIRPETGEILAMVGSVDYYQQPFGAYNVVTAHRQPGSSIKPVMYSLALQKGYTEATIIDDSPVVFSFVGGESYRPLNYDSRFHGKVTLRYALANSYNVPAVRVLNTLGVESFVHHAQQMGISSWTDPSRYGLSLTLGGGEVTMIDMATAFGVFANQGYRVDVNDILKLEDTRGSTITDLSPSKTKVIGQGIAYIISDVLADDVARQWAFGARSFLDIPGHKVAVKTGTTNDKKDNWTIGYTRHYLVAVWVGNNDNTAMNPYLTSGITGAAPIWNRVMTAVIKRYKDGSEWFPQPEEVVEKNCVFGRKEYFLRGTENLVTCQSQPRPSNPVNDPNKPNQNDGGNMPTYQTVQ